MKVLRDSSHSFHSFIANYIKVEEEARAKEKLDEKESSSAEHFAKDKAKGLEGEWTRMLAEALPTGDVRTHQSLTQGGFVDMIFRRRPQSQSPSLMKTSVWEGLRTSERCGVTAPESVRSKGSEAQT